MRWTNYPETLWPCRVWQILQRLQYIVLVRTNFTNNKREELRIWSFSAGNWYHCGSFGGRWSASGQILKKHQVLERFEKWLKTNNKVKKRSLKTKELFMQPAAVCRHAQTIHFAWFMIAFNAVYDTLACLKKSQERTWLRLWRIPKWCLEMLDPL